MNRAVEHTLKFRILEKFSSVVKKSLLLEKIRRHPLSSAQEFPSYRLLDQPFWKGHENLKIQNMSLICLKLLIVSLIFLVQDANFDFIFSKILQILLKMFYKMQKLFCFF